MKQTAVMMMVLSGLCFLPGYFPHIYNLVENIKTWANAQDYCRRAHTDLATVHNEQDLARLNELLKNRNEGIWIGLQADTDSWRWSLENQDYYGEGEVEFRMWDAGEPNAGPSFYKSCAVLITNGKWLDGVCGDRFPFFCYNKNTSTFIPINEPKSWEDAQSYCREHYTDLASVRNQSENEQLKIKMVSSPMWIGLYRNSWKWSDGSVHSFTNWASSKPSTSNTESCGASVSGKWISYDCTNQRYFVCYTAAKDRKLLKLLLKKTDTSMDMEELKKDILEMFSERLKAHGLSGDFKLRWVQPNGNIFHKKDEDKDTIR